MDTVLITEGHTDAQILRWCLSNEIDELGLRVLSAGGKSAADSVARTILVARRRPVALAVDADTTDANAAQEKRQFYVQSLKEVAGTTPFAVELFIPTIEVVITDSPLLRQLARGAQQKTVGETSSPRDILESLAGHRGMTFLALLKEITRRSPSEARKKDEIARLIDFSLHPRPMFDGVCSICGAPVSLPFRPSEGRPTYCRRHYQPRPRF